MSDKVTTQTAGRADRLWPEKAYKIAYIIEIAWNPNACYLFEQFRGNSLSIGEVERCRDYTLSLPPNEVFIQSKHYELQSPPWKIITEFEIDELKQEFGPKRKRIMGLTKQKRTKKNSRETNTKSDDSSNVLQQSEWLKKALLEIRKLIEAEQEPSIKIRLKKTAGSLSVAAIETPGSMDSNTNSIGPMDTEPDTLPGKDGSPPARFDSGEGDFVDKGLKLKKLLDKAKKCLSLLEKQFDIKKISKPRSGDVTSKGLV